MPSSSSDDDENRSYSYDDDDERYEGKKTTKDKKGGGYTLKEGFKADEEWKNDNNNKSPSSSSGKKKKKKTSIKETVCVFIACLFFCSLCLAVQSRSKCLPIVFLHRQTAAVDTRIVKFAFLHSSRKNKETNGRKNGNLRSRGVCSRCLHGLAHHSTHIVFFFTHTCIYMHTYNNNRSNKLNFDRSLGFLQASNPVRKMCSKVANSIYFSRAILFVVILNGVIVALDTPDRGVEMYGTKPHIPKDVTFWLGNAFLILFGLEAIVKIVAYGFLLNGPDSYMWSYWNVFDLFIVITGILDVILDGGGWITTLRLMKCFQPLKALSKYKAGRMVMDTAEKALPMMIDVVLLLLWFVILATVMGVMLFGTIMSGRNYEDVANLGGDPKERCSFLVSNYGTVDGVSISRYDDGGVPGDEELCLNSDVDTLVKNATLLDGVESNVYCCDSGVSPFDNYLNFDNFARGMFIVLHVITIDGWNELAWPVANTAGYVPAMSYFCAVAVLGGFFVFQLFTAVICATLGEVEEDDDPEAHEKEMEELREAHEKSLEPEEAYPQLEHACAHKPRQMILDLTNHPIFQNFITFTILVNTGLMCANHVDKTDSFKDVELIIDLTCSGIFLFEFVLKHIGLGVVRYWKNNWNKLDGFVVLVSIIDFSLTYGMSNSGGDEEGGTPVDLSFLRVFRVFRILRTLKIVRNNAEFSKIANSAISATQNMWVFLLVWLMFLAIFAILGVQLFAARESFDEERLSFKNFGSALITLFAVSTGENTFEVAWSSMKVTNIAAGIYMIIWCFITTAVLALILGILIDAIASETFLIEEGEFHEEGATSVIEEIRKRATSRSTLGKTFVEEENSTDDDENGEHYYAAKRRAKAKKEKLSAADFGRDDNESRVQRSVQEVAVVRQWLVSIGFAHHTEESLKIQESLRPGHVVRARKRLTCYRERRVKQAKEELKIAREHLSEKLENVRTIPRAMSLRCNVMDSDDIWVKFDQEKMNPDFVKPIFMCAPERLMSPQMRDVCEDNCQQIRKYLAIDPVTGWGSFRWRCLKIATNFWFDTLILLLIIASSAMMATNTQRWPVAGTKVDDAYNLIDIIFNAIFTLEMVLKMIGYGIWKGPGAYLKTGFNRLDCFVVLSSLVTYAVGDAIPVKTLRILRVLRPLRTIQRLPGLKLVITVILQSLPAIKYVCIIGFGMMIVLGITGMELFLGQMASCTLAGGEDTKDPLTYKSNLDKAACLEQGGVWRANRFNFDNIGQAIITIFIISTGDNWQDIMYVAMDSTGDDTAPERDANKGAAAFFVFSILFAMMLWANLFVSALVDNFTTLASAGVTLTTEKQREWQQAMLIANRVHTNRWRKIVPKNPMRKKVHSIIATDWFDKLSITMIVLNMFVLIAYRANGSQAEMDFQSYAGYIFTVWYCLESLFLIIGMGWYLYWESMWNKIDFVVAWSGGLGAILPGILPSNIIRMVRFFRLLKVIQVFKGLRTLVLTAVSAIPGVINVSALSLLVIFIFACLGVSLFGNDTGPFDGNAIGEYSNFSNFQRAFTALFIAFSGNWQGFFNDLYVKEDCFLVDAPEPGSEPKCSPDIASAFFFVIYVVLSIFLFGNLFVAILLERFTFAHGEEIDEDDDDDDDNEGEGDGKRDENDEPYEGGPIQVIIASVRLRQILRMFSQKIKSKQELYVKGLKEGGSSFLQQRSMNQEENNNTSSTLGNLASSVPSSTDNSKTKVYVSSPSFSRQFTLRESAETPKANESYAEWKARKKKAAAS